MAIFSVTTPVSVIVTGAATSSTCQFSLLLTTEGDAETVVVAADAFPATTILVSLAEDGLAAGTTEVSCCANDCSGRRGILPAGAAISFFSPLINQEEI